MVDRDHHSETVLSIIYISNNLKNLNMVQVLKKYKAAAVNAEPGWFDLQESVRRTIHWIDEAGKEGCKLIAFPELC